MVSVDHGSTHVYWCGIRTQVNDRVLFELFLHLKERQITIDKAIPLFTYLQMYCVIVKKKL